MPTATLGSIDAALFTTLEGLLATNGGAFQTVQRFASQLTGQDQERQINTAAMGQTPALLLALEVETYADAPGTRTVPGQQGGFVGTSIHRVFVSHTELASDDHAVTGHVDSPGIFELVSSVVSTLAGLKIPGLYKSSRLQPIDTRPVLVKPGVYIYLCRFSAQRFVDRAPLVDASVPMAGATATIQPKAQDSTGALVDGITPMDVEVDTA